MEDFNKLARTSLSDSTLGLHLEFEMGKLIVTLIEPGYPAYQSGKVQLMLNSSSPEVFC